MYYTKNEDGTFVEVTEVLHSDADVKKIKDKNTELRATNTNLLKTNESLSAFADVLDGVQNITPEGLKTKIDAKAAERAEQMLKAAKEKYDAEVGELKTALTGANGQLHTLVLGSEVQKAGTKHGVLSTAYDDVLRRAETVFQVKDGKIVPKDELARDANGAPLAIDTWMENQAKEAPHLFTKPTGPNVARNSNVRTPSNSDGARKSGMDLISSGLAAKTQGTAKRLS